MNNTPQYPKPDRSLVPRDFGEKTEDGQLDLGWSEGTFKDGRSYVKEFWAQDQVSVLTFFFSSQGLEGLDDLQLG